MAMLAERRYRKRYQLCPRGKALYEDETRFGTKMLEKMGWSKGRGLGVHEDGTQDFVRLRFKNDSEGLGFSTRDDQWTAHDDDFNGLLKKLHGGEENGNASDSQEESRPMMGFGFKSAVESAEETNPKKLKEKLTGISLEEKSKQSRARVHYKKFTRGKDLTQYSEKDLANIFGKKATDEIEAPVQLEKPVEKVEEEKPVNPIIGGIQTISTGLSVNDYFKQKMEAMKQRLAENKNSENTLVNATTNGIVKENENGEEAPIKKKKKKKDKHRQEEQEVAETRVLVETVEPSKKKKKSKRAAEDNVNVEQKEDPAAEASNEPKRKKKKKDKEIVAPCELVPTEEEPKKKKKSKKSKNREELTGVPELKETVAEESKKSKTEDKEESELQDKPAKKKSKKSKREEKDEVIESQEEIKAKKKSKKKNSSNDDEMRPTSAELPVPAKEKKSKQHETEVSAAAAAATAAADDIECSSDATSTEDESGWRTLSVNGAIDKMQNSFNVLKISSFCAEKFHILDIDAYKNSSLSNIIGYSFDENIDLTIVEMKSDTQRILNLWEGKLSKYTHQTDNERTRTLVNKLKYKKKLTGAHIKKLQNCNAFSGL